MSIDYRQQMFTNKLSLMGLAIIFIMIFHCDVGTLLDGITPLYEIKRYGDIGVDIFLLLSGFSLCASLCKDNNLQHFYRKRVVRILPAYFLVFGIWYAFFAWYGGDGITIYLYNLFFLNYFLDNNLTIWFIPVILLYYLFLPFYYRAVQKCQYVKFLPLVVILLDVALMASGIRLTFILLRLPIFLIGANLFMQDKAISNRGGENAGYQAIT